MINNGVATNVQLYSTYKIYVVISTIYNMSGRVVSDIQTIETNSLKNEL
jgi:hypothetical protein